VLQSDLNGDMISSEEEMEELICPIVNLFFSPMDTEVEGYLACQSTHLDLSTLFLVDVGSHGGGRPEF
jgi:hypothetical protein